VIQQLLWLISKTRKLCHTSKAQLTAVSSRLDIPSFKHSSQLQLEEIIQALLNSMLQNLQAGRASKHPVNCCLPLQRSPVCCKFCSGTAGVLYLQTLFCPSMFYQSLFHLFLRQQQALPASLLHILPDVAGWNLVTPVVSGTATWCLLPLTFSCSPCSRCCCHSFGLNSTGFMHFLDTINFLVTGPQCSYQVMYSFTYTCKTNGSFC